MRVLLGAESADYLVALERPAVRGLRVNIRKCAVEEFLRRFPLRLAPAEFVPEGFVVAPEDADFAFGAHPYHRAGLFYMQEPSATIAAAALLSALRPSRETRGRRVLDLCAAPGGKSTQLACGLGDADLLVANEINFSRARVLQSNLERMGARRALVTCNSPRDYEALLPGWFDAVLVDAPCSGEGMFRKSDEAVRDWSPEAVQACAERQLAILDSAVALLRPGGLLLYSTCTLNDVENEGVVRRFLAAHPDFVTRPVPALAAHCRPGFDLPDALRLFPHQAGSGGEGHFACLLQKSADADENGEDEVRKDCYYGTKSTAISDCAGSPVDRASLREAVRLWDELTDEAPFGEWVRRGDYLCLAPDGLPPLRGLRVLSAGVAAFAVGRGRPEPCHALALALTPRLLRRTVNVSAASAEARAYLRGESLACAPGFSGFGAMCADGFPLGWGKAAGGAFKNHLPKGLRDR